MQKFHICSVSGVAALASRSINLPVYEQVQGAAEISVTLVPDIIGPSRATESQENSLMETTTS